ncbi:predicted protein [Botrytis cinerea T4]|uniref:Uncharacterized protein n=1 Tax=Botryotinia fuckeliana (strain T4) TaxID=999810 RepID=G2YP34_BOTF4|nr:predicted protein [Botrytis cinerea T4]
MSQLIRHLPHQKKVTLNTTIVCTAILTDLGKSNIAYGSGVVGFGAGTADVGEVKMKKITKPNKHPKNLSLIYILTKRNPHHDSDTIRSRSTQSEIEQPETKQ